MKISILCPSRGRPDRFNAMRASAWARADNPDEVSIKLALDADDPTFNSYPPPEHTQHFRTPPACLLNALAHKADGDILMAASDDILFRTQGWDTKVRAVAARFPDGLFIASPMNGDSRRRVNHWFTGRQWLKVFGWMAPAHFEHFCEDEWVQAVAEAAGRLVYMDDVLIEHMHAKYGKGANDEGYKSKRQRGADGSSMSARDIAKFNQLAPALARDKDMLRKAIG
jgi:hypothetical protein